MKRGLIWILGFLAVGVSTVFLVLAQVDNVKKGWTAITGTLVKLGLTQTWVDAYGLWLVPALLLPVGALAYGAKRLIESMGDGKFLVESRDQQDSSEFERQVRKWLIEYVRKDISGRLRGSLREARYEALEMEERVAAVSPTYYQELKDSETEETFNDFSLAYQQSDERVLLLGPPGSGKTTAILHLAEQLMDSRIEDRQAPVPVFLNLSSYSYRSQSPGLLARFGRQQQRDETHQLRRWILDSISDLGVQGLRQRRIRDWLDRGKFVLLLDGLDEVDDRHVLQTVEDINAFLREYSATHVVIACRTAEYRPLGEDKRSRLALSRAVELQPLTPEQVDQYLEHVGATQLQDTLKEEGWSSFATNPLFLSIITIAYGVAGGDDLPTVASSAERNKLLFKAYVHEMMQRTARRKSGVPYDRNREADCPTEYSEELIHRYLGWLAIRLSERFKTVLPMRRLTDFLAAVPSDASIGAHHTSIAVRTLQAICLSSLMVSTVAAEYSALWLAIPVLAAVVGLLGWSRETEVGYAPVGLPEVSSVGALAVLLGLGLLVPAHVGQILGGWMGWPDATAALGTASGFVLFIVPFAMDGDTESWVPAVGGLAIGIVASLAIGYRLDPALASWIGLIIGAIVGIEWGAIWSGDRDVRLLYWVALLVAALSLASSFLVPWLGPISFALLFSLVLGLTLQRPQFIGAGAGVATVVWASASLPAAVALPLACAPLTLLTPRLVGPTRRGVNWVFNPLVVLALGLFRRFPVRAHRLLDYGIESLLIKRAGQDFEFIHRSLRDYFAMSALLEGMDRVGSRSRISRILRLGQQGEAVVEYLESLLNDPDAEIRRAAIESLGRIPDPRIEEIFSLTLSNEEDSGVRAQVPLGVGRMTGDTAERLLKDAARDPDWRVRKAALVGAAVPSILPRTELGDQICRMLARDRERAVALEVLVWASRSFSWIARTSLDVRVEHLEALVHDKVPGVRALTLALLGAQAPDQAKHYAERAMRDRNKDVRLEAGLILAKVADPRALRAIAGFAHNYLYAEEIVDALGHYDLHGPNGRAVRRALVAAAGSHNAKGAAKAIKRLDSEAG